MPSGESPPVQRSTLTLSRRASPAEVDALVRRILEGDQGAFRTVIQSFETPLRAVIGALVPAWMPVEDLLQESFIRAYQRLGEYAQDGTFFSWLRIIAKDLALGERRRNLRRRSLDGVYEREVEDRVAAFVEQNSSAVDADTARQLRACLARLGEGPRRVVERYYFQSVTVGQIAAEEGRLSSWVYLVLFRARDVLARCLQKNLASEPNRESRSHA